jgi:M42 glutamyl aminopeptidase
METGLTGFLASFGTTFLGLLLNLIPLHPVRAQNDLEPAVSALAVRLASIPAVTGYEQVIVDTLLRLLPGATRDRAGNARLQLGGGSARRLVVCPLDEAGYVVGGIREDGYLTLRRVGRTVSPLFDQQLEGQRVTIRGKLKALSGVVAVRSIHLTRGRTDRGEARFTVDDAYVDVGATSRAEVAALGIRVLAPVTLSKVPHRYGEGLLAAPMAGRRTACAALVAAVRQSIPRAKLIPGVTVAFTVEQELLQRGLATLGNALGPFDETLLVDGHAGVPGRLQQLPDSETATRWPRLGRVMRWSLPVNYAGTPVETVSLADADSLRAALVKWIGGER